MEVVVVAPAVREAMDQPWISVIREHDWTVEREESVELLVRKTVRMLTWILQSHEVDDVDDPHLQIGKMLAEQRRCPDHLQRGDVTATGEHDVGLTIVHIRR